MASPHHRQATVPLLLLDGCMCCRSWQWRRAVTCCVHVLVKKLGGVSLRLDSIIGTRSITKSTVSYHFIP